MIAKILVCALPHAQKVNLFIFSFIIYLGLDPQTSLQTLIAMVKEYREGKAAEEAL